MSCNCLIKQYIVCNFHRQICPKSIILMFLAITVMTVSQPREIVELRGIARKLFLINSAIQTVVTRHVHEYKTNSHNKVDVDRSYQHDCRLISFTFKNLCTGVFCLPAIRFNRRLIALTPNSCSGC